MPEEDIRIVTADAASWPAVEELFADTGDARRCWCAYWFLSRSEFKQGCVTGSNRDLLELRLKNNAPTGIVAIRGEEPVGWCGIAPRQDYDRLQRPTVLSAVDDTPVWSITCFVVRKGHRRQGLMDVLLAGAVDYARRMGAEMVEGYPLDAQRKLMSGELYVGTPGAFKRAGFTEVERRSPNRPIMRLALS
ncbi:GNAT family N-acetyltransferase [Radicibacter daui]|uniref:GNAT family N-acetyltransferase n=1 Tax=Radicibacter daui TaxID=3064829 RepID=UPI00404703CB